jgi:hypothetical protein
MDLSKAADSQLSALLSILWSAAWRSLKRCSGVGGEPAISRIEVSLCVLRD